MSQSRWNLVLAVLFLAASLGVILAVALFMPNAGGYLAMAACVALLTTGINSLFKRK